MEEKELKRQPQPPQYYYDEDEIDLAELFKVLYKRRKFIIGGVFLLTLLAVIISLILPKTYQSEGFYRLNKPELSPGEYRKIESIVINQERFRDYINNYVKDNNFKKYLLKKTENPSKLSKEMKEFINPIESNPQKKQKLTSNIIGVKITPTAESSRLAYNYALLLGKYIRNSILYDDLSLYIISKYYSSLKTLNDLNNKIIHLNVNIKNLLHKKVLLTNLIKNYPQSKTIDVKQIISVEKGGYRYLSPVLQIIGLESQLADLKTNLRVQERKKKIAKLNYEFYKRLYLKKDNIEDGDKLYNIFQKEYKDFFKNKDFKDDVIQEVFNSVTIQLNNFKKDYYENMKFISGPTIPTKPIKPKKRLIVAVTFVTSIFLFIFLAFFKEWWENNKSKIEEE